VLIRRRGCDHGALHLVLHTWPCDGRFDNATRIPRPHHGRWLCSARSLPAEVELEVEQQSVVPSRSCRRGALWWPRFSSSRCRRRGHGHAFREAVVGADYRPPTIPRAPRSGARRSSCRRRGGSWCGAAGRRGANPDSTARATCQTTSRDGRRPGRAGGARRPVEVEPRYFPPCLTEAALMPRVLEQHAYLAWLEHFLRRSVWPIRAAHRSVAIPLAAPAAVRRGGAPDTRQRCIRRRQRSPIDGAFSRACPSRAPRRWSVSLVRCRQRSARRGAAQALGNPSGPRLRAHARRFGRTLLVAGAGPSL